MRYSKLGYWGAQTGAIALMLATSAIAIWLVPADMIVLKTMLIALASVAAAALALTCYRSADEVILQTHKTAWFWGGLAGIIAIGPFTIAVLAGAIPLPQLMPYPHRQPADYYAEGVIAVLLIECVGFIVVWAYHNFGRRE